MKKLFFIPLAALLLLAPVQASAILVDLELALMVDISGSVDANEFAIQRNGYEAAFRDATVISQITGGSVGSIAATMVYWSTNQAVAVGWTQISDATSANAFADAIAAAGRPGTIGSNTGIAGALTFGANSFANNFEGTRRVMDVSGDGTENVTTLANLLAARNAALAGPVNTINGLGIGTGIATYYASNVIGGPGAFAVSVDDFSDFAPTVRSKILREITPVPEPASLLLLGTGLFGAAGAARRRRKRS